MSYDKKMEELLVAARQSPTELSYDEVEFLFLNPTSPPLADPPWWRGGYLKFLLMFTLLISLIGFLLPTQAALTDYKLSAFPVQEETPAYLPTTSLPVTSNLLALAVPEVEIIVPQVQRLATKTVIAPAAAPASSAKPAITTTETSSITNKKPISVQKDNMPPALFKGEYSVNKDFLMLSFKETAVDDAPVNLLFVYFTDDERRQLKQSETSNLTIKREAGSLLLYKNGKKGRFEYLPDSDYLTKLTAKGWGPDTELAEPEFISQTEGMPDHNARPTDKRAVDQLWFRYFTYDINEDYIMLLQNFGYTTNDLADLWQLANWGLKYDDLKAILELSASVLTDRPPLAKLHKLSYKRDKLEKLQRNGERLSFTDFINENYSSGTRESLRKTKKEDLYKTGDLEFPNTLKREKDLNFSLERPGTKSDTITYTPGEELVLEGNFEYRFTKDLEHKYIVVFGPAKAVAKMKRRSNYKEAKFIHKNKKSPLFIELPLGANLLSKPEKGVTIEIKTKRSVKQ